MTFTQQQFQLIQTLINDIFQNDAMRSGPMGSQIISIRGKFMTFGDVDLTAPEKQLILAILQDVNITSRSPIVQSQFGVTLKLQSPAPLDDYHQSKTQLSSQTSQISNRFNINAFSTSTLVGSYTTMWNVLQQCLVLLGQAPPPKYVPLEVGPTGDPDGISPGLPNTHPPDDGTGYNHT